MFILLKIQFLFACKDSLKVEIINLFVKKNKKQSLSLKEVSDEMHVVYLHNEVEMIKLNCENLFGKYVIKFK